MKKVLIIEDTLQIRENIAELLEIKQYQVLLASDGEEALQLIRDTPPDLVICDVKMPKMGGFELKKALNNQDGLSEVPFIFLSAAAQKTDVEQGRSLGAAAYLTKPFKMSELIDWVERLL
jgi:CheY-like chemotaxis protein